MPTPSSSRERWNRDRLGSILARQRELSAAVIEAPRSGRSAARIELARFLMANRLDPEAVGVLSAAALDDPTLTRQRQFLLLQAIALARANRAAEARRVLATDLVAEDPEAVLWRAVLDARGEAMGGGARNLPAREGVDRRLSGRYPGRSAHCDGAGRNRDEGYRSRAVGDDRCRPARTGAGPRGRDRAPQGPRRRGGGAARRRPRSLPQAHRDGGAPGRSRSHLALGDARARRGRDAAR